MMAQQQITKEQVDEWIREALNKAMSAYQAPAGGIGKADLAPAVQASLGKADSAVQTEADPTVPSWAKQPAKPSYTAAEIGADENGAAAQAVNAHNASADAHAARFAQTQPRTPATPGKQYLGAPDGSWTEYTPPTPEQLTGTPGNFAGFDENGHIADSLHAPAEFATAEQGAKADSAVQPETLADYRPAAEQDSIDARKIEKASIRVSGNGKRQVLTALDFAVQSATDARITQYSSEVEAAGTGADSAIIALRGGLKYSATDGGLAIDATDKANVIKRTPAPETGSLETAAAGQLIGSLDFDTASDPDQTPDGLGTIALGADKRISWQGTQYTLQEFDGVSVWNNLQVFYDGSAEAGSRWVVSHYDFAAPVVVGAIAVVNRGEGPWGQTSYTYQAPTEITDLPQLDAAKPARAELTTVVTDYEVAASGATVTVTLSVYNAETQQTSAETRTFPLASAGQPGAMPAESFAALTQAISDIASLKAAGGKWIGQNFATKAALDAWAIPDTVNFGDWTDVIADESKAGEHTRYALVNSGTAEAPAKTWAYQYDVEQLPIGLATSTTAGLVKGSEDSTANAGKIFAEADGTQSVIGWDALVARVGNLETWKTAHDADETRHITAAERAAWGAKYDKPAEGIPKADLTQAAQDSLAAADSALQAAALDPYRTSAAQDLIDADKASAADLTAHTGNADIHVTAAQKTTWNGINDVRFAIAKHLTTSVAGTGASSINLAKVADITMTSDNDFCGTLEIISHHPNQTDDFVMKCLIAIQASSTAIISAEAYRLYCRGRSNGTVSAGANSGNLGALYYVIDGKTLHVYVMVTRWSGPIDIQLNAGSFGGSITLTAVAGSTVPTGAVLAFQGLASQSAG
jgi:hypothetical protein